MKIDTYDTLRKIAFDGAPYGVGVNGYGSFDTGGFVPLKQEPQNKYSIVSPQAAETPAPRKSELVVTRNPDAASIIEYYHNSPRFRKLVHGSDSDKRKAAELVGRWGVPQLGPAVTAGFMPAHGYPKALAKEKAGKFTWNDFKNIFRSEEAILNDRGDNPYRRNSIYDTVNFNPAGIDPIYATYKMYAPIGEFDTEVNLPVFKQLHNQRMQARARLLNEDYNPNIVYPVTMSDIVEPSIRRPVSAVTLKTPTLYYAPSYKNLGPNPPDDWFRSWSATPSKATFLQDGVGYLASSTPYNMQSVSVHEGLSPIMGHVGTSDDASWGTQDRDTRVALFGEYGDPNDINVYVTKKLLNMDWKTKEVPDSVIGTSSFPLASAQLKPPSSWNDLRGWLRYRAMKRDADSLQRKLIDIHNRRVRTGKWEPDPVTTYGNSLTELGTYGNNVRNIAAIRDGKLLHTFDPNYTHQQKSIGDLNHYMVSRGFWKDNWADPKFDRNSGYRFSQGSGFSNDNGGQGLNDNLLLADRADVDIGSEAFREIANRFFYLQNLGEKRNEAETKEMRRILSILQRGMEVW